MRLHRPLSVLLALALALCAPGQAPYAAAASVARGWKTVIAAGPASGALGHLRLDLALSGGKGALTELTTRLPAGLRDPEAFARLSALEQSALWGQALALARAELAPEALALAAKAEAGALTPAEAARLETLASAFYLLPPELGQRLRALQQASLSAKAKKLAEALSSRAVASEVDSLIAGAERLTKARPDGGEKGAFTRDVLAPYAKKALDDAAARLVERGIAPERAYRSLFNGLVFGGLAPQRLIYALRLTSDWSDFVAAVALETAARLAGSDAKALSAVGAHDELRLAVPAWHPQAGLHETVADWLAARFGAPPAKVEKTASAWSRWSAELSGDGANKRLFTVFGVPVLAARSLLPGAVAAAVLLALKVLPNYLHGQTDHFYWAAGLAIVAFWLASVFLHELGHALAARRLGVKVKEIVLHLGGGYAAFENWGSRPRQELLTSAAGPLVTLALGGLFLALSWAVPGAAFATVLSWMGWGNLALAAFNSLPVYPIDGGLMLTAGLWAWRIDKYRAVREAVRFSAAFTLAGVAAGAALLVVGGALFPYGLALALLSAYLFWPLRPLLGRDPGTTLVPKKKA